MRISIIAPAVIAMLFVSAPSPASQIIFLSPTHDVSGAELGPNVTLSFNLYVKKDGQTGFKNIATVNESPIDISQAMPGCYDFYLTATRHDTSPPIESDPSETVLTCVNLDCGAVGVDGTVGQCHDNGLNYQPMPPEGIEAFIETMM